MSNYQPNIIISCKNWCWDPRSASYETGYSAGALQAGKKTERYKVGGAAARGIP